MNTRKRKSLKKIAGATSIGFAAISLPKSWTKPVLNSVVLPAHAQTSMDNQAPIGQNVTVDAFGDTGLIIELGPLISDPEGNPITIIIVASGVIAPTTFTINAVLQGEQLNVNTSGVGSAGSAFVDYQLSDGMNMSVVYRVTIDNLSAG